jgi:hypothetical protein
LREPLPAGRFPFPEPRFSFDRRGRSARRQQITVGLGDGARLVSLEQAWHRSRADERWEPGMAVKIGWQSENCLVLR